MPVDPVRDYHHSAAVHRHIPGIAVQLHRQPHDHGPSWAIYGQAQGKTVMSDWAMVEAASEDKPGKVRHVRSYTLEPGMAHVYNEGDLHSPRRDGPTRLIRVEGRNMDHVRRLRYEKV